MAGPSNSVPGPSNSMTGLFDVPIGPSSLDTVVVPASEPDFNRSLSNHPHEKKPASFLSLDPILFEKVCNMDESKSIKLQCMESFSGT
jgi:exosome complex RNA-binding protein Rrp4